MESTITLESLSLACSLKSEKLKHDIAPILYSLGENRSLTHLDISGQQMGNRGAIALAKGLQQNNVLASLVWDDNLTTLLGFVNIKSALKVNQTLKKMPLPVNDISQAMRSESSSIKEIQSALIKIEKRILRNQQQD